MGNSNSNPVGLAGITQEEELAARQKIDARRHPGHRPGFRGHTLMPDVTGGCGNIDDAAKAALANVNPSQKVADAERRGGETDQYGNHIHRTTYTDYEMNDPQNKPSVFTGNVRNYESQPDDPNAWRAQAQQQQYQNRQNYMQGVADRAYQEEQYQQQQRDQQWQQDQEMDNLAAQAMASLPGRNGNPNW